ncbi:NACHT domain-containing protein [Rheinheimera faecalis]|uniref:NACHT domain-containing protein n=1 Tax=Rheinheimera faecalis TaxID=2901141 RepID=UPI001E440762|nr:ATP-binding protein [Rheinheimera faecalis]
MLTVIGRTFQNVPDRKINDSEQSPLFNGVSWERGSSWESLLESKRILIISEAGVGKTYECRAQAKRLWSEGEPAFFLELAALATEDVDNLLDYNEGARLKAWLSSQSEIATFFLDSVDELKLTKGTFNQALKRLNKCIQNQLHRVRIIITTRPIPYDEQLIRETLPVPKAQSSISNEVTFALSAMGEHAKLEDYNSKNKAPDWRRVELIPLSDEQIIQFARTQGVSDPEQLLKDLERRNAQEFARRPQDLMELCVDWREHKRIRTHLEQVTTNIRVKLLPAQDRDEPAELSVDKAIEGASRLALAVQMTRRLTIRHSAASDGVVGEAALDPAVVLSDWLPYEIKALLERPIFGFASYGRVRFHHRSVAEFLASQRLVSLRKQGMPFRALKRLLFAETKGKIIVRPSKRSVAGWLALQEQGIFELLRDNEPAVLLNEGDPESLTQAQRNQVLHAFADRYGPGGWRCLQIPSIQVHRFATIELADHINQIWLNGVENPDVREILLNLIEVGRIKSCADLVFNVINDPKSSDVERLSALDALVALDYHRLGEISESILCNGNLWSDRFARGALLRLFPSYMSVEQLCNTLRLLKSETRSVGDLGWHLVRLIAASKLCSDDLEKLRNNLVELVSEGLGMQLERSQMTSVRSHLSGVLAATCERGLDISQDDKWLYASLLALRLDNQSYYEGESIKNLNARLSNLNAEGNERLFWVMDSLCQKVNKTNDPLARFIEVTDFRGPVHLRLDRDLSWVKNTLGDKTRATDERAMLLEAAIRLYPEHIDKKEHNEELRQLVADFPPFEHKLGEWLKPSKHERDHRAWEKKRAEQKQQDERRKAKNHASWVIFWREVANHPERAFSSEQAFNTAWNLWRAMSDRGADSRTSGWNRRFLEELFNAETANRLRLTLMNVWRNEHPSFPSERPANEQNTHLIRWQLGLASIYAEAEDLNWAAKLTNTEARLAARYVQIELNGFPLWIDALVESHPHAVDDTLGNELTWELNQSPGQHGYSSLLQGITGASEKVVRLFLPRLVLWLDAESELIYGQDDSVGMLYRVRQITQVILKHGDSGQKEKLQNRALKRLAQNESYPIQLVWMSVLLQLNPSIGIDILERLMKNIEPTERSDAVKWFASLFGGSYNSINLSDERFTPNLLLRLLRLAYHHVRIEHDAYHEGSYSPDTRDDAEQARNKIVTALFSSKGDEGLAAKLEMAADPLCVHFKARILAVAEENWAQEIDADTFDEAQAVALDRKGEAPAMTNEAMFAILKDRLYDLDEVLLRDTSPRETWATISVERAMRREIARELSYLSNSLYTVDQEAATADEKETDIRLRSTFSKHEAVIELKLADDRSANDLLDTIENQLVKKYMSASNSKAGALLVTIAKDRKWDHPVEGHKIKLEELLSLLTKEAERVQMALGGDILVTVHLLDLRPRLSVEPKKKLKH